MDYNYISQDSPISKLVDGLVILVLGVAIGVVLSQVLLTDEVTTVTSTSEITRRSDKSRPAYPNATESSVGLPEGSRLEEN